MVKPIIVLYCSSLGSIDKVPSVVIHWRVCLAAYARSDCVGETVRYSYRQANSTRAFVLGEAQIHVYRRFQDAADSAKYLPVRCLSME